MRDDSPPGLLTVGAIDELLVDAKLSVPQPRPSAVSRAQVIERARSSGCPVVGISAPAGYGKTTLLAEWAAAEDRAVGWVSLDRFDDDPRLLLTLLASAFARVSPGHADLIADVGGLGVSTLGRAAPRLAAAFRTSPHPFVLMLDDLHELQSPDCHDVLSVAIAGVPHGSQVVAASRSEQPHLPRLRAAGTALELLAGDLALDAAGAEHIFSHADIELSPEQAASVAARTEGWPVGLYLAALIATDSSDTGFAISGDDRYIADYLYREALLQLTDDDQRFLRHTAVLDQLCAPLCEAVVGAPGAPERLRALEAASLFLVPLDRRREWYRYHGLFREFLLGELRRVEPDVVSKLHLRAADWYESNGSPAMAVEHLLNTDERDRCIQLVTALVLPTYQSGQISTVQRWLSTLGEAAIVAHPPLAVLAGWIAVFAGQTVDAGRWAAIVDAASFDHVPADGSASFESARAMLRAAMCTAGPASMLVDGNFAADQEPAWSVWRDTALCMQAEALLLTGDAERAAAVFAEASGLAAAMSNTDSLVDAEAELAVLAMDRRQWDQAAEHLARALAAIDEHRMQDYPTSVLAFAGAARLAVHRGDRHEAERQLTQAMRSRPSVTFALPYLAVRVRLELAKAYWALADAMTARHLLQEIDDVLHHRPALGTLVDEVTELRRAITSPGHADATGASPLTAAELRLLPYLQTHHTIRDIAQRLFVSRNTVNSQVSSIYRKLGVSSRDEAVQRATATGLLGG